MPAENKSLKSVVDDYLKSRRLHCAEETVKQDRFVTTRFCEAAGNPSVKDLTPQHVEDFFGTLSEEHKTRDGRVRPPINAATWNYYYARIKALAGYLASRGLTRHDLMAYVRPRKVTQRTRLQPSPNIMWQMLDAAKDGRDRALLATACNTGLRASTLAGLRIGDVSLEALSLHVRVSKSRLEDDMPMTSDLAEELDRWLREYRQHQITRLERVAQNSDFLFPARRPPTWKWDLHEDGSRTRTSVPGGLDPLRPVRKPHVIAQAALERLGFESIHEGIHTLRRGAARALFDSLVKERGYDGALRVVSSFLHHSNVSTTERYLGLAQERRTRDLHLRGRSLLGPRPEQESAKVLHLRPEAE